MFLFFKVSNHFFIFFWSPKRLDISGGEMIYPHYGQRCCNSCADITESSHWVLMEPSVSMETGVPVYKHRSPAGSFECAVSGLRWVCTGEVTLQYHFSDPDVFRAEVAMLQYTPISSLMDIKVLSGELLEAHLPHFACLDGSTSSLSDAVRVLRGADTGITLETCELTRFHAKLLKPSFSLTEVLVKIHLEVLIYRTRVTPLVLFTYVVPWNASMMQSVKDDLRQERVKKIERPQPDTSLWIDSKYNLRTSCHSEITPDKYTLNYERANFFEVYIKEPEECFDLELISGGQSIWKTPLQRVDYGETQDVTPGGVKREVNYTSKAATPSLDEGRMASLPYRGTQPLKHYIRPPPHFYVHNLTLNLYCQTDCIQKYILQYSH